MIRSSVKCFSFLCLLKHSPTPPLHLSYTLPPPPPPPPPFPFLPSSSFPPSPLPLLTLFLTLYIYIKLVLMDWVHELLSSTPHTKVWRRKFLVLKKSEILVYDSYPVRQLLDCCVISFTCPFTDRYARVVKTSTHT